MAQQKVASLRSHLFAHKGTARPATGFRVLESALDEDEAAEAPASSPYAEAACSAAAAEEDPRPAGSLQRGGFQLNEAEPIDVGEVEPEAERPRAASEAPSSNVSLDSASQQLVLVPPPPLSQPVEETRTAEGPDEPEGGVHQPVSAAEPSATRPAFFGSDLRQQILIPVGLAALLLVAAAMGYRLSTFLRGNSEESAVATSSKIESASPASVPVSKGDRTTDPIEGTEVTDASVETPVDTEGLDAAPATVDAPVSEPQASSSEPVTVPLGIEAPAGGDTEVPVPVRKPSQVAVVPVADTYVVQIGSLPSREGAEHLWQQVTEAHSGIFAGLKLDVQSTELDGQSYFRARTGQFSGFKAAETFCQTLRARDLDCLVVKP